MAFWIICVLSLVVAIFSIIMFNVVWSQGWEDFYTATGTIASLVCAASFLMAIMQPALEKDEKFEVRSLITSTSKKDEIHGFFILGSGAIGKKTTKSTYYYFYKKEKQGGWKLTKASAYNTVIFEDENKNPYYVKTGTKKEYNELHLPKKTIKKDIKKINLEGIIKNE